jgi:ketosteroid isomerase-like protein
MPSPREVAEAQIRQQINQIVEGIRAQDLEGLKRLYSADVVSFDVEPPLQHVGVDAKMKNWAKVFTVFQDASYEVRDLMITVGDDVAFGHCFARLGGTLKNGAATSGIWVRATFCFQKTDSNWLIAHDQVSVPLDIQSGKGVTDLEPLRAKKPAPTEDRSHDRNGIGHRWQRLRRRLIRRRYRRLPVRVPRRQSVPAPRADQEHRPYPWPRAHPGVGLRQEAHIKAAENAAAAGRYILARPEMVSIYEMAQICPRPCSATTSRGAPAGLSLGKSAASWPGPPAQARARGEAPASVRDHELDFPNGRG